MGRLALLLCLLQLAAHAEASVFPVDLSESDPAGIDDLPGITEEEARSLREAAGPGPEDLARRLASTGLDPDRLVEWAPYLGVGATGGIWDIRATVEGAGGALRTARQSIRVSSGRCRIEAAWKRTQRSPLGQEHAWLSYGVGERTEITAGAIKARWTGPAPWEDPLARGRTVYGDDSDCVPAGATGARGLSLQAPGLHCMGWRDPSADRGWMGRLGGRRLWVWGGTLSDRGGGGGIGFPLGAASITCAAHVPSARGRFLRIGVHTGPTALALAAPIGRDQGSGTARIDMRSRLEVGRIIVRGQGSFLQRSSASPLRRSGAVVLERSGSAARVTLNGAWTQGGGRFSCRAERRLGIHRARLTAGWRPRGSEVPTELQLGILRDTARIQGETTFTANDHGGEAGLRITTSHSGGRVHMGIRVPLGGRAGPARWDISVGERGG